LKRKGKRESRDERFSKALDLAIAHIEKKEGGKKKKKEKGEAGKKCVRKGKGENAL